MHLSCWGGILLYPTLHEEEGDHLARLEVPIAEKKQSPFRAVVLSDFAPYIRPSATGTNSAIYFPNIITSGASPDFVWPCFLSNIPL